MRTLCLVFVLLLAPLASAQYYVDPGSGDNGNAGTSTGAAWETLSYALANASASSAIYLMTGDYDDLVLSGPVNATSWSDAPYVTPYAAADPNITRIDIDCNWVDLRDVDITHPAAWHHVGGRGIDITGSHVRYSGTITGDWDVNDADYTTDYGVLVHEDGTPIYDVNIHDVTVSKCWQGIELNGDLRDDIIIQDCNLFDLNGAGVEVNSDENNGTILIEDIVRGVQTLDRVDSVTTGGPHGAGISIRTVNVKVRRCEIWNVGGSGAIRFYGDTNVSDGHDNMEVTNCLMYTGVSQAFFLNDCDVNCVIANNTLISHYAPDLGNDATRYVGGLNIRMLDSESGPVYLYNNVILGGFSIDPDVVSVVTSGGNLFYSCILSDPYGWQTTFQTGNTIICTGDGSFNDGFDVTWAETSGNLFDLPANYTTDYLTNGGTSPTDHTIWIPRSDSMLVDSANATYAPDDDLRGYARDASPDMGAYEYGATSSSEPPTEPPATDGTKRVLILRTTP